MTIEYTPRRRCDRPNCNATVTESHGLIGATLTVDGVASAADVLERLPFSPPDLCHACKVSLVNWWWSLAAEKQQALPEVSGGVVDGVSDSNDVQHPG